MPNKLDEAVADGFRQVMLIELFEKYMDLHITPTLDRRLDHFIEHKMKTLIGEEMDKKLEVGHKFPSRLYRELSIKVDEMLEYKFNRVEHDCSCTCCDGY